MCAWLHEQGLGSYVAQGPSWIKSGQTLLRASQHDLEKVGFWVLVIVTLQTTKKTHMQEEFPAR